MSTKKPAALPEPLHYLQPFANALAKLPPEDLNEDVDVSRLDAALRKRVRGLNEEAADAELARDRDLLERWLTDKPLDSRLPLVPRTRDAPHPTGRGGTARSRDVFRG